MRLKSLILLFLIMSSTGQASYVRAEDIPLPPELAGMEPHTRQVVVVTTDHPEAVDATVNLWHKTVEGPDEVWRRFNAEPIPAVVGRNGLAPAGQKREGDGRTPTGTFELYRSFGYDEMINTDLEYHQVTAEDFWIDDPASVWYNQWVSGQIPSASHEILRRSDDLYKYAIIVEYNTDPAIPGNGSAIFIHLWRGKSQPTAGCVAMAEPDLLKILGWLKQDDLPVVVIRPKEARRS
ncbi:MAG: L,D-transpeptidase [Candidatus Omnitrophota bacterium]